MISSVDNSIFPFNPGGGGDQNSLHFSIPPDVAVLLLAKLFLNFSNDVNLLVVRVICSGKCYVLAYFKDQSLLAKGLL